MDVFPQYQVIWHEAGSGAHQLVKKALAEGVIAAPVSIEVTGVSGVKEAVRAGLGIGFASSQTLVPRAPAWRQGA